MTAIRSFILGILLCLSASAVALAQTDSSKLPAPSNLTVTLSLTANGVRFAAPSSVVKVQVEVFSNSGQSLFEASTRGSVLDWTLQDGGGARLGNGSYLCVVTVKSLNGKLSQRIGTISVQDGRASLQAADAAQLSLAQQQAVGPLEENASISILPENETPATALLTHDGQDGQVTSTTGALTFRTGDLFAGTDKEQMRVTPEGNVGIGTTSPQAKLDVVGAIRTTKGIEFPDGTVQTTASQPQTKASNTKLSPSAQSLSAADAPAPISGAGTTNQLAKWTDGPSNILGSSVITESGGNIGIGATPSATLHLFGNPGAVIPFKFTNSATGKTWHLTGGSNDNNFYFTETGIANRLTLQAGGNVGIGTSNPGSILHVEQPGSVNLRLWSTGASPAFSWISYKKSSAGTAREWWEGVGQDLGDDSFSISDRTAGATRFLINSSGNIGIGTTAPSATLHLFNNPAGVVPFKLTNSATGKSWHLSGGSADDNFYLVETGVDTRLTLQAGGNVGIGITNPSAKLHLFADTTKVVPLKFTNSMTGKSWHLSGGSGDDNFYITETGVDTRLTLQAGGNVGIGITNPSATLHLFSNPRLVIPFKFTNSATGKTWHFSGGSADDNFYFTETGVDTRLTLQAGGNVGIGTMNPQSKLDVVGDIRVSGNALLGGNIAAKYQDMAEWVPARQQMRAGTVVVLDVTRNNTVAPSSRAYDTHIAGVVSAQPGLILGEGGSGKVMVATTGRVIVKVDATRYPIRIGDLLVTSGKPGVAMRSQPIRVGGTLIHRPGTIIGKALEPLSGGVGEIRVLLSLQ